MASFNRANQIALKWVKDHLPWVFTVESSEHEWQQSDGWLILSVEPSVGLDLMLTVQIKQDKVVDFELEDVGTNKGIPMPVHTASSIGNILGMGLGDDDGEEDT